MEQMARNAIDEASGHLRQHRFLLRDRDTKFCASFRAMLATGNVKCVALPPRDPIWPHSSDAGYDRSSRNASQD